MTSLQTSSLAFNESVSRMKKAREVKATNDLIKETGINRKKAAKLARGSTPKLPTYLQDMSNLKKETNLSMYLSK